MTDDKQLKDKVNNETNEEYVTSKRLFFLGFSFWVLFIISLLLPVFFLPTNPIFLYLNKTMFLYIGVLISSMFFLIYILKGGKVVLPLKRILIIPFLIILFALISAIVGGNLKLSFWGYSSEVGTLSFLILFFSIFFLTLFVLQGRKRLEKTELILLIPFFLLSTYYILKVFVSSKIFSIENMLGINADTLFGGWNELALFSGAVIIFSAINLSLFRKTKLPKWFYYLSFILALVLLVIINFRLAWILTLIVYLLYFFIFRSISNAYLETNQIKVSGRILFSIFVVLSLIFILPSGDVLKEETYNVLEINHTEVKPSWKGTTEIFLKTLGDGGSGFFLGAGPNNFSYEWRLHKPLSVNTTDFWNTDFNYGAGLIPTLFINSGFFGMFFWIAFIFSLIGFGIKYVLKNKGDIFLISFFGTSLYFWLIAIFYPISHVSFTFVAIFSGIFLSYVLVKNHNDFNKIDIRSAYYKGVVFCLLILLFTGFSLIGTIFSFKKFGGDLRFEKGVLSYSNGDLASAEGYIKEALDFSDNDIYRGFLSEIYLENLKIYAVNISNPNQEQIDEFKKSFEGTIDNINLAITLNPRSFENRLQLGRIYSFLSEIRVEGSYDSAQKTFEDIKSLDPLNPLPDLLLAELEISQGNLEGAEEYVLASLDKKSNYGEALLLHSRIKFSQGDLDEAIKSSINTVNIFPSDPYTYFHLGLLYYQNEEYAYATNSFEKAIELFPQFANAKYFLALSLSKQDKIEEAIQELVSLSKDYPDSVEVSELLDVLEKISNSKDIPEQSLEDDMGEKIDSDLPFDN